MGRYENSDFELTVDGDLVIENGDIALVHKKEFIEQSARNRIRTSDPDWFDYKVSDIGANLEDIIGLPNTPDTAKNGIQRITECLTKDNLIDPGDIYIRPVPTAKYVLVFFIFIRTNNNEEPMVFDITFNLETGMTMRGEPL